MDALGGILEEVCFRKEKVMELLRTGSRHVMTKEDLAEILASEQGTRKGVDSRDYYVILNKCDDRERTGQAEDIRRILKEKGITSVTTSLQGTGARK